MALDWFLIAKERGYETPRLMFEKLYIEGGQSLQDIATMIRCSPWTVGAALDKFGIPRRPHGGARRKRRLNESTIVL